MQFSERVRLSLIIVVVALCLGAGIPFAILQAQPTNVVVSVAVPEYLADAFTPEVLRQFEASAPGVKVNVVKTGNEAYYPGAAYDPEKFFEGAARYASSADVLYVNQDSLTVEGTRAGFFLDLAPLTSGDAGLKTEDFIPVVWQSFQWDKGVWALPISANVIVLSYDPAAFDKAGLAYPTAKWTFDDLAGAARKLAERDASGKVTRSGFVLLEQGALFRSALGEGFYDSSALPNPPQLDKPGLATLLDTWAKLSDERLLDLPTDWNSVPLRADRSYALASTSGQERRGALLPGGKAGLAVDAFAVSGGTRHPDKAYALAKFLTGNAALAGRFFGITAARKSVNEALKTSDTPHYTPRFSPENQAMIDQALANALPVSETRYADYVNKALILMGQLMGQKKTDARSALREAEAQAVKTLQTAAEWRAKQVASVATPVPVPVLKTGEVSIRFVLSASISPLPNRDRWEQAVKEFTGSDPQVRQVVFETTMSSGSVKALATQADCFYLPYSAATPETVPYLLNLDPLMSADTGFDKNDFIGSALSQLRLNEKTWGLPIDIQAEVLRYNTGLFNKAGLKAPGNDWTINAFNDALKALKVNPSDDAPFVVPPSGGGTYVLMLAAAYGGLPLDTRTDPPTVNFTVPANVDALRQVLDLARKGYIKYQKLFGGGGGGIWGMFGIYPDRLNLLSFRPGGEWDLMYQMVNYPRGSKYTPVSYTTGAGYVSARAPNPEACYHWLSFIGKRPELFQAMPARRSLLESQAVAAQGAATVAFYKELDKVLQDPKTLSLPSDYFGTVSPGAFVLRYWLYRAFDRYVLQDGDLEAELKEAEGFAKAYIGCIARIPPGSAATEQELNAYYRQFTDCAVKVDSSLKSFFGQ